MKASVQYDDFVGTAAADISDFITLHEVLKNWGVDTERYYPVGISFFSGTNNFVTFSILCEDRVENSGKIVKISYDKEPGYSIKDIMELFKRFEVIITTEGLQDRELVDEPIVRIE